MLSVGFAINSDIIVSAAVVVFWNISVAMVIVAIKSFAGMFRM